MPTSSSPTGTPWSTSGWSHSFSRWVKVTAAGSVLSAGKTVAKAPRPMPAKGCSLTSVRAGRHISSLLSSRAVRSVESSRTTGSSAR